MTTPPSQDSETNTILGMAHSPLAPGANAVGADDTSNNKCVHFDDAIKIIRVEIDVNMRKLKWYRKSDYKRFHHEKKETLRHFRYAQAKFQRIEEDIFCLRGFEACLSVRAVNHKMLRKVAAIQAVLDTQYQQRMQGISDPSRRIQLEYHKVTAPCRNQALERAQLDAREVLEQQQMQQEPHQQNQQQPDAELASLKYQFDRLMQIKSGPVQPSLRSATSGPLQLRKTVPSTA